MTEFQILTAIRNNGGSIGYVELLNKLRKKRRFNPFAKDYPDAQYIEHLLSMEYISGSPKAYGRIKLEPSGTARLVELTQERTQRRKQFSHDWMIAAFSIIGGALLSNPLWEFIAWLADILVKG